MAETIIPVRGQPHGAKVGGKRERQQHQNGGTRHMHVQCNQVSSRMHIDHLLEERILEDARQRRDQRGRESERVKLNLGDAAQCNANTYGQQRQDDLGRCAFLEP